jgi:hypothetical protein
VSDGQHEQMSLVLFERDHIGGPLDGGLADHWAFGPRARPWRIGFWGVANSIEGSRNLGDELVAQSRTSLVVPKRGAEARRVPQDAVRGARRWSSSFRISVRAVSQLIV